jgi:HTH-type transcriptional regulator/antitoxin HigA
MSNIKDERELLSKPGDTILETIEELRMSQAELAKRMGKTPSKINDLISGKEPITVVTAVQLEKVLGVDVQFWLNREAFYREKLTRIEQEEALEEFIDWLKQQPIKQLKEHGYIKAEKVGTPMVEELLKFYAVDSPKQWELIYVNDYATTSFRKSKAHATALSSMTAWLRIGEIEMRKIDLTEYNKENFKNSLHQILQLVVEHPDDFPGQLQEICRTVGVAIVYTLSLPHAPISGAARWVGGQPLIQLTDRYKTNDQFWFSFFHEAGHILLHGKKDVFIEEFEGYQPNNDKEDEANEFAARLLLSDNFMQDLPDGEITEKDIRLIARKYHTHPAIVLGRLQKNKLVSYSFGASMKMKVVLDYYIKKQYE